MLENVYPKTKWHSLNEYHALHRLSTGVNDHGIIDGMIKKKLQPAWSNQIQYQSRAADTWESHWLTHRYFGTIAHDVLVVLCFLCGVTLGTCKSYENWIYLHTKAKDFIMEEKNSNGRQSKRTPQHLVLFTSLLLSIAVFLVHSIDWMCTALHYDKLNTSPAVNYHITHFLSMINPCQGQTRD